MTNNTQAPLIVVFADNLMITTRIAQVIDHIGYRAVWIESAEQLDQLGRKATPEPLGEQLHGREGRLFELLAQWQPALLVFDLNNDSVPWREWVAVLKSAAATRRIPVMAYSSHVEVEAINDAKSAGADVVLARGRFLGDMPDLLQKHARIPDRAALAGACAEPLSELARAGIERFNEGAYYPAHDSLEEAWVRDTGPGRDLYRGILQVGIAYYQLQQGNYRGAVKMLLRVRQWLTPLPDVCRGVDVAALRDDVERVYAAVVELGPERLEEFDTGLFGPVKLI